MWKNISINKNQIAAETSKSVLINMPHNSEYNGFSFWHPSKLVRQGKHNGAVSLGYTDEFIFKLKKYGKGKYNGREVIDEMEISAAEFAEAFGATNDNIKSKEYKSPYETHKPTEHEAINSEAIDELKD